MTNEEFQDIVIRELGTIKEDISDLKLGQARIETRLDRVETRLEGVETRLERVETKLNAVHEQTAVLTEFKTETSMKLDYLLDNHRAIHEVIGRHEIEITALKKKAV